MQLLTLTAMNSSCFVLYKAGKSRTIILLKSLHYFSIREKKLSLEIRLQLFPFH